MSLFMNWKFRAIVGTAILGGIYGLAATLGLRGTNLGFWEIAIPALSGAALCASGASAVCRWIETCKLIRESTNRPVDRALCYRGVRYQHLSRHPMVFRIMSKTKNL